MIVRGYEIEPGADLRNSKLSGADLSGADLKATMLKDANLRGADLHGANLYFANLIGANLQGANLRGADLSSTYLVRVNLTGANLTGANLTGANLTGANLTGACLQGANLKHACFRDADLRGADLTGAYFEVTDIEDEQLKSADGAARRSRVIKKIMPAFLSEIAFKIGVVIVETPKNRDRIAARLDQLSTDVARLAGISKEATPAKTILAAIEESGRTSEILEMVSEAALDCADMW